MLGKRRADGGKLKQRTGRVEKQNENGSRERENNSGDQECTFVVYTTPHVCTSFWRTPLSYVCGTDISLGWKPFVFSAALL